MERRIQIRIILIILLTFVINPIFSQIKYDTPKLRVKIWSLYDQEPSLNDVPKDNESLFLPSERNLKKIGPFLLQGMIYGWNFTYTPSDKLRQVEENFEFSPISSISVDDPNINWDSPVISDSRITIWLEYERTDSMMSLRNYWHSIQFPRITGIGQSKITLGIESIEIAVSEAAKNAIRNYAQGVSKNKPKLITGSILLKDENPTIYIKSGYYTADLDFFLHVDTIEQYSHY